MFLIQFLPNSDTTIKNKQCNGIIKINDFEEDFCSSLSFWSKEKYQSSWKSAIEKILSHDCQSSLITDIHDPQKKYYINWWLMYREKEKIYFQNQLLISNTLNFSFSNFDPENPFEKISSREIYTEDGEEISEWLIEVKLLENFYNQIEI